MVKATVWSSLEKKYDTTKSIRRSVIDLRTFVVIKNEVYSFINTQSYNNYYCRTVLVLKFVNTCNMSDVYAALRTCTVALEGDSDNIIILKLVEILKYIGTLRSLDSNGVDEQREQNKLKLNFGKLVVNFESL